MIIRYHIQALRATRHICHMSRDIDDYYYYYYYYYYICIYIPLRQRLVLRWPSVMDRVQGAKILNRNGICILSKVQTVTHK